MGGEISTTRSRAGLLIRWSNNRGGKATRVVEWRAYGELCNALLDELCAELLSWNPWSAADGVEQTNLMGPRRPKARTATLLNGWPTKRSTTSTSCWKTTRGSCRMRASRSGKLSPIRATLGSDSHPMNSKLPGAGTALGNHGATI